MASPTTTDDQQPLPKNTTYHLYTFYASSCAARIRIALHLKNIPFTPHYIDMQTDAHESPTYQSLNPSASIPTLVITTSDDQGKEKEDDKIVLTQSLAILEYLEETFPTRTPLLPPIGDSIARARVRQLTHILTSDIFPPTNSRIAQKVKAIRNSRDDAKSFVISIMTAGFTAYEAMLQKYFPEGPYSAGKSVTLADVCLVPQVEQARFYGVDFGAWPLLNGVIGRLEELEAFKRGAWRAQGDTPEKDRVVV